MKLSVITPSLNQAQFLPATLESVRHTAALIRPHTVEHIVRDGGSTDGSIAILQDQQFAQWTSTSDQGQADAINQGWRAASGDIFCYLCSDDLFEADNVAHALEIFERDAAVDVVYGDYFFLEGDSGWKRLKKAGPWSRERLLRGNFISQPATFWRRRVYERYGGLDTSLRYCLDHEYWLRISEGTVWSYLPQPLATMRLHSDSKTCSQLVAMWWESAAMQRRYHDLPHARLSALRMQLYGHHFYRMKRAFFQWLGRRKNQP